MKSVVVWCVMFVAGISAAMNGAYAQTGPVTIRVNLPANNQIRISDVLTGEITNRSTSTYRVYLRTVVEELSRGTGVVVDARSRQFDLPPGTTVITSDMIEPFAVDAYNKDYYEAILQSGVLPSGDYRGCTQVMNATDGSQLATTCNDVVVQLITQPFLVSPTQRQVVDEQLPVFSWMGTIPPAMRENIFYRLRIVEVFGDQTAEDAAMRNPAFLDMPEIRQTQYLYPMSARMFVPGQTYAWYVSAYEKVGTTFHYLGQSEVWSFSAADSLHTAPSTSQAQHRASGQITNDIVVKGRYRLTGQTANRQGTFQEKPADFVRAEVSPTVVMYGIPLGASLIYASEQLDDRQQIQALSLRLDPDVTRSIVQDRAWQAVSQFAASDSASMPIDSTMPEETRNRLSAYQRLVAARGRGIDDLMEDHDDLRLLGLMSATERAMLWMPKVEIGTVFPHYTPLTVSGVRVEGVNVEWNPGGAVYMGLLHGTTQRSLLRMERLRFDTLIYDNSDNRDFDRTITAARFGFGSPRGSHWIFTGAYSTDSAGARSINDTTSTSRPRRNVLASMDLKLEPFKGIWSINAEVAGSIAVGDLNAPKFSTDKLPPFLLDLIDSSSSAFADWSALASTQLTIPPTGTRLQGSLRRIGSGYNALSVPFMRVDVLRYDASIDQSLLDQQITFGLAARKDQDNLIPLKRATTITTSVGGNLNLRIKGLPHLRVSYMPYVLESDATDSSYAFGNTTSLLSASGGYSLNVAGIRMTSQLSVSRQQSNATDDVGDYAVNAWNASTEMAFASPLNVRIALGSIQQTMSGQPDASMTTIDGSVSYGLFGLITASGSFAAYLDETYGDRYGYSLSIGASVFNIADVQLRAERALFDLRYLPSRFGNSYQENILRLVVSKSW